ncbi:MAG: hypothetical protein JWQ07_3697 [Ramlibacter sp.]|nr:hypothetical protein [Ramlibacter sp.]
MLLNRKFILALAALVGLLAGCGGGDEPATLSPQAFASAQRAPLAASISAIDAAELLLNAAEAAYPQYFPGHQTTQTYGPFRFRQYGSTLIGVVVTAGAGYDQYGVYVVSSVLGGTLQSPRSMGLLTTYLTGITIDTGLNTGHTLVVNVSVQGVGAGTYTIYNVPEPVTQVDFCSGLAADATFAQISASGGGTMTINNCSFTGNSGSITATLSITSPYPYSVSYTITYTYQ